MKAHQEIFQEASSSIDQNLKIEMAKVFVGCVVKTGTLRMIVEIKNVQISKRMLVSQVAERMASN